MHDESWNSIYNNNKIFSINEYSRDNNIMKSKDDDDDDDDGKDKSITIGMKVKRSKGRKWKDGKNVC